MKRPQEQLKVIRVKFKTMFLLFKYKSDRTGYLPQPLDLKGNKMRDRTQQHESNLFLPWPTLEVIPALHCWK